MNFTIISDIFTINQDPSLSQLATPLLYVSNCGAFLSRLSISSTKRLNVT